MNQLGTYASDLKDDVQIARRDLAMCPKTPNESRNCAKLLGLLELWQKFTITEEMMSFSQTISSLAFRPIPQP